MAHPIQWARYRWQRLLSTDGSNNGYTRSSLPGWFKASQPQKTGCKHRLVIPCLGGFTEEYEKVFKNYMTNRIQTNKYTLLNFIPKNLFAQFHRVANLYFLFIVVLNWVPLVEAFQKEITMLPLVVVLAIIGIKDGIEDYRRYKFDKQINNRTTKVYDKHKKKYLVKWWKEVHVGDFIQLSCNEIIPADMVLLYSTDVDGICHIETSNLDGETNLKQRQVVKGFTNLGCEADPEQFASRIECESPNNDLNRFKGYMIHQNKERVGLSKNNLLLRGCTIRNTEAVVGIVVYAGHETKAMMNNSGPRYKRSKLERRLNTDVLWCVVLLFMMCLTGAFGHGIWLSSYLHFPTFNVPQPDGEHTPPALAAFYMFWTMIILLQVLIPISLYVSIEIVKLGQILLLQSDVDLYDENTNSTIQCRALNITEDLGQIEYLFSDKTGTLTENKMVFCRCNIAGIEYFHEENAKRLEFYQDFNSEDLCNISEEPICRCHHSNSCRSLPIVGSHSSLNFLTAKCSTLTKKDVYEDKHETISHSRQVAFSTSIERDVAPDSQLLRKLELIMSQPLYLSDKAENVPCLEYTYILDFFLALAICNTVVVSSLNQPRQRVRIPSVSNTPSKSLEEIKQMFHRFSVSSASPSSLSSGKYSSAESPSTFTDRLLNRVKPASSPNALQKKKEESVGLTKKVKSTSGPSETNENVQNVSKELDETADSSPAGQGTSAEELRYEAESPDEAALVHAARAYKCTLISKTCNQVTVELNKIGQLHFQLLHILPFDSIRKRMSVVVRHPLTNKVVVYTKGADSVMMDLLDVSAKGHGEQKIIQERTQHYLDDYAKEGLRTLCIAKKVMNDSEYAEWVQFHLLAETSIDNQEELLFESALKLETNLTLLGATGIVDRLQEGVPDTIVALRKAKIKIWVLTGDKQETAVNIAYACKLLERKDSIFTLNTQNKEACEDMINKIMAEITEQTTAERSTSDANCLPTSSSSEGKPHIGLVIDGKTLEFVLHESLQDTFLELTKRCCAVICCRSTPLQKSKVVRLVRNKLKVMTLAIGDGANDVSMIQMADVGIGISGQEGMQAVMSSDFAISRFKHLKKLLLVHGHWCYTRLANMILYFFYKNVAYVNLLFWYQLFCGFSGTSMIDYWILILFNLLFTSVPPIIYGILDKDVSAETLLQLPELYSSGQHSEAYLSSTFWITILDAFYQSLVCFFVPYFTYFGSDMDIYSFGTPINTAILCIILLHLMIEGNTWTWIHWAIMGGSALLYFVFALAFGGTCVNCNHPSNPYWIMERQMSDPLFYLVCILATVIALLPRYAYRIFQGTVFPTPLLKARQLDKQSSKECKKSIQEWNGTPPDCEVPVVNTFNSVTNITISRKKCSDQTTVLSKDEAPLVAAPAKGQSAMTVIPLNEIPSESNSIFVKGSTVLFKAKMVPNSDLVEKSCANPDCDSLHTQMCSEEDNEGMALQSKNKNTSSSIWGKTGRLQEFAPAVC
ncbi:probable phospholipid-transporting ATPase VD isoform X1 [Stegostoma tigrinum]|uniref:probable phospholipid-transporting ATPase VD isoform X1 n=1 Tax=Stegostoma tigrinum TaxID=3053191 RepID=UPI00202AC79D|nr:probable phospholipid-transporting ATPase VD isoform X1 [Stegostoma tigrinum]